MTTAPRPVAVPMTAEAAAWVRSTVLPARKRTRTAMVCACQWPRRVCPACAEGRHGQCFPAWGFEQPLTAPPHGGFLARVWLADRLCTSPCLCACPVAPTDRPADHHELPLSDPTTETRNTT